MIILPLTVFPLFNTQGVVPKSMVLVTKVPGVIGVPNAGTLVTVAQGGKADEVFSKQYYAAAQNFYKLVDNLRTNALNNES